ncbi:hypothetical protein FJY63_09990 [Candidatus Sumerlaeota bacterium]|nr:hypothetical protein [Candidatus Sumerlaeota bacterium]
MRAKVTRRIISVAVFLGLWQMGRAGEPALRGLVGPTSPPAHVARPTTDTIMLMYKIHALEMRLMASREALTSDPEIIASSDAARKAEDALDRRMKELTDGSTETARLRAEMAPLRNEMTSQTLAVEKKREAARRYHELAVKMRSIEERLTTGAEIVALTNAVQRARTALEQKIAEKLKANPKTAPLVRQRDELREKLEAIVKDMSTSQSKIALFPPSPSFGTRSLSIPAPQTPSAAQPRKND